MLAKATSKNRVTLPKAIVQQIPDTEYFDVSIQKGAVLLKPVVVSVPRGQLRVVQGEVRALGLTEGDVEGTIRWGRGRKP